MAFGFFDLKVWQKADDLAVNGYQTTPSFPAHQRESLTDPMQRAAVSVAANKKKEVAYYGGGLASFFVYRQRIVAGTGVLPPSRQTSGVSFSDSLSADRCHG